MFLFAVLLHTISIGTISATCNGAQLYSVTPQSDAQVQYLRELDLKNETLDFWLLTRLTDQEAHVLVPTENDLEFRNDISRNGLQYFVKYSDTTCDQSPRLERFAQYRSIDSLDFTSRYLSYNDINKYIDYLGRKYPEIVTLKTIGNSFQRRPLRTVTISSGQPSKTILIDAGIHGREWIAPATALYVINRLVQHADENRDLLRNLTWIILPIVNPDGYEYSLNKNKYWRKTRQPFKRCVGTDANRNFGFQWGGKGASRHECVHTYAGTKPFSEPETQALREVLLSESNSIKFYLTLHSYGRFLLYPWGYKKEVPRKWQILDEVSRAGSMAMKRQHNVDYRVGGAAKLLYEAAGGSDDYALAVARIPISITMELPGDDRGFHPVESKIKPFQEEAFTGIRAMALKMMQLDV